MREQGEGMGCGENDRAFHTQVHSEVEGNDFYPLRDIHLYAGNHR